MRAIARWLAEQWFSSGDYTAAMWRDRTAAQTREVRPRNRDGEKSLPGLQGLSEACTLVRKVSPTKLPGLSTITISRWASAIRLLETSPAVPLRSPTARFAGGLFCGRRHSPRLERSFRTSPGRAPNRQNHPRPENFAFISAAVSAAAKSAPRARAKINAIPTQSRSKCSISSSSARSSSFGSRGFAYDEINAAFAAGADDLVDAARSGGSPPKPSVTRKISLRSQRRSSASETFSRIPPSPATRINLR